ncbi:phage integrase SAM-like domain-containing protein [Dyadobacter sp. 3J3]|uniref:phage integrase SAM-like domain-containing protein n=1 Tax=Dyadobacter sp. 3J3 TaxID=2606600 RepID=UPI001357ED20|nr:phage integrase SAM-like domain-containing protein [Dyadobacter sp. 3J3]
MARYEAGTKDNVNFYFSCLRSVVDKTISDILISRIPVTKELVETALKNYNTPATTSEEITFFKFIDQFISDLETGKRMLDGNKIADPKTVQWYKTAKNSLAEFEEHEKIKLTFDSWTEEMWKAYVKLLTFTKKFKMNNVGFYQKQHKLFLKAARKATLFTGVWSDDVKVLAENPVDVFLNKKELELIENHDLSDNPRLDRVRDLFLVGCNCGFRISDWNQVR